MAFAPRSETRESSRARRRAEQITRAPALISALAVACPIPALAPVTRAVFPDSFCISGFEFSVGLGALSVAIPWSFFCSIGGSVAGKPQGVNR